MFQKIIKVPSSGSHRNRSKSKDFWNDLQIVYTSPQVVAGETISKYNPFRMFGRNFQIIYKSLQVEGSENVDFMQDLKKSFPHFAAGKIGQTAKNFGMAYVFLQVPTFGI